MKTEYLYNGPGTKLPGVGNLLPGDTFSIDDSHPFVQDNPHVEMTSNGQRAIQTQIGLTVAESENPDWPHADMMGIYHFWNAPDQPQTDSWGERGFTPFVGASAGVCQKAEGKADTGALLVAAQRRRLVNSAAKIPLSTWALDPAKGGFTIAFWWKQLEFNSNNGVHEDCMFSQYTGDNAASSIKVYRDRNTGKICLRIVDDQGNAHELSGQDQYFIYDQWVHVAISYFNGGADPYHEVMLILNGSNVGSVDLGPRTINQTPTADQIIGASGAATVDLCSDGIISQLAFWRRPMFYTEVRQIYNEGKGLPYVSAG